jgi:two-component system chemotaxis response regulator CheY
MAPTVLVCDDSLLMRRMISQTLTEDGWEVVGEAADGLQAVDQYKSLRPDAVTLDIVMPGHDGLYALHHIRQLDPSAKIVIVSALNQTKCISEAIRAGAQDFIVKPFMPDQLQTTLRSCVPQSVTA